MEIVSRVGDAATTAPLRVLIREDYERAHRSWGRPGLHGLLVYRVGRWALSQPALVRRPVTMMYRLVNNLVIRNVYGMEIDVQARIGRRVLIGHHQGVQIPAFCIIGDNSVIRQNVNIGYVTGSGGPTAVPHIGRHVRLGPGCQILGPVTIGDEVKVGPNAVVTMNIPAHATVVSPPARVIKSPIGTPATADAAAEGIRP